MKKKALVLNALSDFFDSYLPTAKGLSVNTITSYRYAFQLLFEYLDNQKSIAPESVTFQTLCNDTILEYLNWLESERGCGAGTRNQRLAAISSFAKYAMRRNLSEAITFGSEVMNLPKKKARKTDAVVYFSIDEIGILLGLPDPGTKIGKRDMVLMSVLYASGARAQELCDLTVNDVRFGKKTSLRLVGKGDKARVVIIPDDCSLLLKKYLDEKRQMLGLTRTGSWHVFSSQTHEHMTISCVEGIVKKYVAAAKAANPALFRHGSYSPHSFRHSIAVHMLESGIPLPVIKNFLGHASLESTLIYATVSPELASKYLREKGLAAKMPEIPENAKAKQPYLSLPPKAKKNNPQE